MCADHVTTLCFSKVEMCADVLVRVWRAWYHQVPHSS